MPYPLGPWGSLHQDQISEKVPVMQVPMERRINRVTAAVFHFSSGAVGSLTHSLVLHTSHYQTGIHFIVCYIPAFESTAAMMLVMGVLCFKSSHDLSRL